MTDFAISSLADITDTGTLSGVISGSEHTAFRDDVESRVANLNDAAAALESNFAGSSAPTDNTVRGKFWADTSTSGRVIWKGDPDGSGADIVVADSAHALGPTGVLAVDTTAVARAGATGTLITYTIPANTLDSNGRILRFTCWGTKTAENASANVEVRFGSADPFGQAAVLQTNIDQWFIEVLMIRTGSSTQDVIFKCLNSIDSGFDGATPATSGRAQVLFATDTEDDTATIAFDLNVSSINASDTVTQEGLIVEILN